DAQGSGADMPKRRKFTPESGRLVGVGVLLGNIGARVVELAVGGHPRVAVDVDFWIAGGPGGEGREGVGELGGGVGVDVEVAVGEVDEPVDHVVKRFVGVGFKEDGFHSCAYTRDFGCTAIVEHDRVTYS